MKYAWIDGERKAYPLPAMRTTLAVSISGYRAWKRGGQAQGKRLRDPQLLAVIRAIHAELKGAYGAPRMLRELRGRLCRTCWTATSRRPLRLKCGLPN